jgi:hypothetical protein
MKTPDLTFITDITSERRCELDLVTLWDGRVLGIDEEAMCLYRDINHVFGEDSHKPLASISFEPCLLGRTTYAHWVEGSYSLNTGGNCMVDILELSDNRVLGITDDAICLYKNLDAFWECRLENIPTIYLTPDIPPK